MFEISIAIFLIFLVAVLTLLLNPPNAWVNKAYKGKKDDDDRRI